MKKFNLSVGFAIIFSTLYFFDNTGVFSALVPAACVHELGHILVLRIYGAEITSVYFEATGIRMDYFGPLSAVEEMLSNIAGCVFGLLFAVAASLAGKYTGSEYLYCCAGVSLVLSLFNLLPAKALDGGKVLHFFFWRFWGEERADFALKVTGAATAFSLIISGVWALKSGLGAALLIPGVWLLFTDTAAACKNRRLGVK